MSGATLSLAAHAIALVIVAVSLARTPAALSSTAMPPVHTRLVYAAAPGGGGDPGGGDRSEAPARRAQLVGREAVAVPSARPVTLEPANPDVRTDPPARVPLQEPAVVSGLRDAIGAIAELRPIEIESRGAGSGLGADGRRNADGIGDGNRGRFGGRIGPGADGEDGVLPGNGVSWPQLVQEVKPAYTAEAMRARVAGVVELEIVVLADGSVGRIRLTRSLDPRFGLDQAAVDAVRRWRFRPARHFGKAVAVRVPVELSFQLR